MKCQFLPIVAAVAFAALMAVSPAAAQATAPALAPVQTPPARSGWTFTPSLFAGAGWDDNALIRGEGDEAPSDVLTTLNPRAAVNFRGRRGEFAGNYDGSLQLYRTLSTLDNYDQHAGASGRRLVSKHVELFTQYQLSLSPTTELAELVGVPYVRVGSESQFFRGGVDAALSKRGSLSASYNFQTVDFEQSSLLGTPLLGGHSHGILVTYRRAVTPHASLTVDYDLQHSEVGDFQETNDIHRFEGGVEFKPDERTRVFGALGMSRLLVGTAASTLRGTSADIQVRAGPSWRAGVTRQFEAFSVDGLYSRSFVPSYGFGGTQQNEDFTARVRMTISRTVYAQSGVSWRFNEPLTEGGLKLRTGIIEATLGYLLAPWVGVEGYYDRSAQKVDRPGGIVNRNRIGVQIVTTKPMRIR